MASGIKARRISRSRKFLYDQEVEKILNEENSLKSLVTSFEIADDVKQRISKDPNLVEVLKSLEEYSKGVCQITVNPPDSNHSHSGCGFYLGDGWILTTASVIRNRNQVNYATFTFVADHETFTYQARDRRAFVYRTLPPGRRPDYHNRDLTLVKLGVQYTFRQDVTAWEKDEQALLGHYKPFSFQSLSKQAPASRTPQEDDILCTVYHGNTAGQDSRRFYVAFDVSRSYKVLDLGVLEFAGGFEAEASGCPVFVFRNGQFYFLGVFLPGPSNKPMGSKCFSYTGQALLWDAELTSHITTGTKAVDKMSSIVSYSLEIPFEDRKKLLTERTVYQAAELALNHRVLIL
ncbi:hypothetical protein QZH41_001975 [Actinostola sp. cb2023]|nr:hypothetical protein QZH41_001975 [Actinostola sp. cb2023]